MACRVCCSLPWCCCRPQVPLFPGDSELQQLLHIFKLLGTPDDDTWEGVSKLRDWHEFPNWRKQARPVHAACPRERRSEPPSC